MNLTKKNIKDHTNYYIILYIIMCLLWGCNNYTLKKDYYETGELKFTYNVDENNRIMGKKIYYYKNGMPREIALYKSGVIIDTIRYFDEEGKFIGGSYPTKDSIYSYTVIGNSLIKESAFSRKSKKASKSGWLKYYDDDTLKEKYIYKSIYGKGDHINQFYSYDKDGIINKSKSFFFNIILEDTLKLGEKYEGKILFNSNTERTIGFFTMISDQYTANYSNIDELRVDTVYNDESPRFFYSSDEVGTKKLRGKFTEQFLFLQDDKDTSKVNVKILFRDFYFEKSIHIIDTILGLPR